MMALLSSWWRLQSKEDVILTDRSCRNIMVTEWFRYKNYALFLTHPTVNSLCRLTYIYNNTEMESYNRPTNLYKNKTL